MAISGVRFQTNGNCKLFHVDDFDKQLKSEIRAQLVNIFHGFSNVESLPVEVDYKYTLKLFLAKIKNKSVNTRKGMVGELLANILVAHYQTSLKCLSVIQNKEENNVKKGFDIVYFEDPPSKIWYTEVKSGRSIKLKKDSNTYNTILLNRSAKGIKQMFSSKRDVLWTSAMIDVELMVKDFKQKKQIKEILTKDSPVIKGNAKKNAILVSVLYHQHTDAITINTLTDFYSKIDKKKHFAEFIVFSIQKETFTKVINFLKDEAK